MRLGILGGGVAGLSCAHYALRAGFTPIVFEAEKNGGAEERRFDHGGTRFDYAHRPLLDSDTALVGLFAELGALDQLVWRHTRTAVVHDGQLFPFDTAQDLLRFEALSSADRLRAGAATMRARLLRYAYRLDGVSAQSWLRSLYGTRIYDAIWAPLLQSRFGEHAAEAPAYWAWQLLGRGKTRSREVRGAIRGGRDWLASRLRDSICNGGGEVIRGHEIESIDIDAEAGRVTVQLAHGIHGFDAVISTLGLDQLGERARGSLARELPQHPIAQLGSIEVAVVARARTDFYTTAIVDPEIPFHAIHDSGHLLPSEQADGSRVFYLVRYESLDSEGFHLSDEVVSKEATAALDRAFGIPEVAVLRTFVTRDPQAAPVWTHGTLARRLPVRVGDTGLYLCSPAHAYPRHIGSDTQITLAREVVSQIFRDRR